MRAEVKDITEKALKLPSSSRAFIAEILLESLDFEEDFVVSKEWMHEIQKRCREIDEGKVKLIKGETAISDLEKRYL